MASKSISICKTLRVDFIFLDEEAGGKPAEVRPDPLKWIESWHVPVDYWSVKASNFGGRVNTQNSLARLGHWPPKFVVFCLPSVALARLCRVYLPSYCLLFATETTRQQISKSASKIFYLHTYLHWYMCVCVYTLIYKQRRVILNSCTPSFWL